MRLNRKTMRPRRSTRPAGLRGWRAVPGASKSCARARMALRRGAAASRRPRTPARRAPLPRFGAHTAPDHYSVIAGLARSSIRWDLAVGACLLVLVACCPAPLVLRAAPVGLLRTGRGFARLRISMMCSDSCIAAMKYSSVSPAQSYAYLCVCI